MNTFGIYQPRESLEVIEGQAVEMNYRSHWELHHKSRQESSYMEKSLYTVPSRADAYMHSNLKAQVH